MKQVINAITLAVVALLLCSCGGGGGETQPGTPAPSAPTVTAAPEDGQAQVSWPAVSGATSYNVYTSSSSPVTTASTKTSVATPGKTLPGLANGTPVYVAVTSVGAGGESSLSNEACAVPTAAATAGLTLFDPLCASTLSASKWRTPLFSRGVASGAMVISTQAWNMEPLSSRGLAYTTPVSVTSSSRVSSLEAKLTVPAATASRTGGAEIRASLRLVYQPPATRLNFPAGQLDQLIVQVGLLDDGSGPRAFRAVQHCDNAGCSVASSSGVTLADPPGFSGDAAASYDTTYVVSLVLDEATGIFTWSIAGGSLNLSGTADPAVYLAGNANWVALGANPLAGSGFLAATPRTRIIDNAGGSNGQITARFDDVKVGLNNAAAVLWDDFSGAGGNSGPTELSTAKWTFSPGKNSMAMTGGSLNGHAQVTKPDANQLAINHTLDFFDSTAFNTVQADFTVATCTNSSSSTNRVGLAAGIYNDGTPGTTPPDANQPNSRTGDIVASLFLDCPFNVARFQVSRFDTNSLQTILSATNTVPKGPAPVIGNTHTLKMKWDPNARLLTFQVDGQTPVVVDPTTVNASMLIAAPYVKGPNTRSMNLNWFLFLPGAAPISANANVDFKANNVFTAP